MRSSLGFKIRLGNLTRNWQRHTCNMFPKIHLWGYTCWHLGDQYDCQTILFHVPASKHWQGLKLGSIAPLPHIVKPGRGRHSLCRLGPLGCVCNKRFSIQKDNTCHGLSCGRAGTRLQTSVGSSSIPPVLVLQTLRKVVSWEIQEATGWPNPAKSSRAYH